MRRASLTSRLRVFANAEIQCEESVSAYCCRLSFRVFHLLKTVLSRNLCISEELIDYIVRR